MGVDMLLALEFQTRHGLTSRALWQTHHHKQPKWLAVVYQLRQEAACSRVAANVPLKETTYFVTARKHIRAALQEDGIAQEIEELVERLLAVP